MSNIPEGFRRVSFGGLVAFVHNAETGEWGYPGLLWRNGLEQVPSVKQFSAIGGALLLTRAGRMYVQEIGGQLVKPNTRDARMYIPEDLVRNVATRLQSDRALLVPNPGHELVEELAGNELGMGPVLPDKTLLDETHTQSLGWYAMAGSPTLNPAPEGRERADDKGQSERLFQGFVFMVRNPVWRAMHNHPAIRWFTEREILRTEGGLTVATADDGETKIGNNMIHPRYFRWT